jgi:hypothetical protein
LYIEKPLLKAVAYIDATKQPIQEAHTVQ